MRAVRLHGVNDLRFEHIPSPGAPEPGWVHVRVEAAGICGSDLHNFRTGQWISRSPSVAGHELCGVVIGTGEGVEGFAVGDSVVADSRFWCGACMDCRSGHTNSCEKLGFVGEVCDGGFAEEIHLPARLLHKRDGRIDARIAAMAEPLAVALHAVRKVNVPAGEPVLVVGCGTIGGLCAVLLSRLHEGPIVLAERNAERARIVATATGGRPVELSKASIEVALDGARLRYAIDATGSVAALAQTIALMAGGGALALVGISHGNLDLDPNVLVEKELSLIGCHAFRDELPEAIALLGSLEKVLIGLLDETIALEDVPSAFERLVAGRSHGLKTVIRISD